VRSRQACLAGTGTSEQAGKQGSKEACKQARKRVRSRQSCLAGKRTSEQAKLNNTIKAGCFYFLFAMHGIQLCFISSESTVSN